MPTKTELFDAQAVNDLLKKTWPNKLPKKIQDLKGEELDRYLNAVADDLNLEVRVFNAYRGLDAKARKEELRKLLVVGNSARKIVEAFRTEGTEAVLRPLLERAAKQYAKQNKTDYSELGFPVRKEIALKTSDRENTADEEICYSSYREEAAVDQAIKAVSLLQKWTDVAEQLEKPKRLGRGPEVRFIGLKLPALFKCFFAEEPGVSPANASGDVPDSPMVRFAECVLDIAGIKQDNGAKYSRHTIVKYVQDFGKDERRRKS